MKLISFPPLFRIRRCLCFSLYRVFLSPTFPLAPHVCSCVASVSVAFYSHVFMSLFPFFFLYYDPPPPALSVALRFSLFSQHLFASFFLSLCVVYLSSSLMCSFSRLNYFTFLLYNFLFFVCYLSFCGVFISLSLSLSLFSPSSLFSYLPLTPVLFGLPVPPFFPVLPSPFLSSLFSFRCSLFSVLFSLIPFPLFSLPCSPFSHLPFLVPCLVLFCLCSVDCPLVLLYD